MTAVAVLTLLGGCTRSAPAGAAPAPEEYAAHPGFDRYVYPGDDAMRAWRAPASPYRWVGFYLPAPCHRDRSWAGRRATLSALGWGVAVLYVGQQTWEGQPPPAAPPSGTDSTRTDSTRAVPAGVPPVACAPALLGTPRGIADADDAMARAAAEGFAAGTVIFLDVERMTTIPQPMRDYYTAWVSRLLADGRYRPGIYAHAANVAALYADVSALYPAGSPDGPPFWVASGSAFAPTRAPGDAGFPFATIWQGSFDTTETWGGVTLRIDVNVASTPSPSAPVGITPGDTPTRR